MRRRQQGLTTVEFALVGLLTMIALFAVLEVARAMFVYNALEEATRRGARVAAVCQVNDAAIAQIASFTASGAGIVGGLRPEHFAVEYLNEDGNVLGDPIGDYLSISFVRVRVVDFMHRLLIPLFARSFQTPSFETTLPRESLGVWPGGYSTC
jgi:hypothetical protein